jgi:hypothetical protein
MLKVTHAFSSGPIHVRWVQCHHSMAHPQVADGRDRLQLWRVAVNTEISGQPKGVALHLGG